MTIESVTSETLADFNAAKLGLVDKSEAKEEPKEVVKEEVKEEPKADEPKTETEGEHKPEPVKKNKIEDRFREVTAKTRAAEERAEKAERELAELRTKAEPVKPETPAVEGKPQPSQFTDAFEYAEALAAWSTKSALAERDQAERNKVITAEREKVVKGWTERVATIKTEIPDFDEMIASSPVAVHNELRDAIIESEHGPNILYLLASDEELAKKMENGAMSIRAQLKELGRLETQFDKKTETEPKEEKPKFKAPEPITPVRGTKADNPVNDPGEFKGTYSEWKAIRQKQVRS